MTREKFERRSNYKNIGEIGREHTDENNKIVSYTIDWVMQNQEEYKQQLLQKLIEKYGEDEGKRQFEIMKQEADERWKAIQNMSVESSDNVKSNRTRR